MLGQVAIAAKSNEIPAVRDLLACFDLTGAVVTVEVTVDAMHTQIDTATAITAAGGEYVFTVKGNTSDPAPAPEGPALERRARTPPHRDRDHTHKRITRTIKVAAAPDWVGFPDAGQVAQVRRTVTTNGKKSVEVVYLITSADPASTPAATLAAWVQGHWGIENRLHWVRDVTYDEDRSTVRTGQAPRVMATLRNTVISLLRLDGCTNIAKALRHHARDPERTITCLLTC